MVTLGESIASGINSILGYFGYRVRRVDTPMRTLSRGLENLATHVNPKLIIDIGVANGTPELYSAFPAIKYKYLLIEASPVYSDRLHELARTMKATALQVFCGREDGEILLHSDRNPEFSSAYVLNRPTQVEDIRVPMRSLDSILEESDYFPEKGILLKIDVEGAELDVLHGATRTLERTEAVIIECSIAPKYKKGAEFADVVSYMKDRGFSILDLLAGASREGKLYQLDAVFVRTNAAFR